MIHWDWILTGLIAWFAWKFCNSLFTVIASLSYSFNRRVVINAAQQVHPVIASVVEEVMPDVDQQR